MADVLCRIYRICTATVKNKTMRFLISCLFLGLSVLTLIKLVRSRPLLSERVIRIEERGLYPETQFYTELPAMPEAERNLYPRP